MSLLLSSGFFWILANFLTNISTSNNYILLFARLALVGAALTPLFFLLFVESFVSNDNVKKKKIFLLSVLPVLIIATTPTNLNVISASVNQFTPGPVYPVLMVVMIVYFIAGFRILYKFKHSKANFNQANQINYMFAGFIMTVVPSVLANGILPIFGISDPAKYGSMFAFFLPVFITISIIKHSLFDIRLVVLRTVGYVSSVGSIVVLFSITYSLITEKIIGDNNTAWPRVVNIILLTTAILSYPSLKKYFDKITNKYFFRDAYDPQEFLDQLNKNIVSNIEIGILLRHTTQIIQDNLKCSYCTFVVHETDNEPMRLVGNTKSDITQSELISIRDEVSLMKDKVIQRELLDDSNKNLKKIFNARDIEFLVHLKASSYGSDQTIAYMLFGPKNSGNLYSSADFKIMDIISDELVIAIQNALRFEEIQEFNVTLQKKVNDATGKLKRTNEKLKALDETKDEFISMASHQLRTPLTSVKGYLSMVLEGDAGEINENQRKLLDQAFVSSQRMVYLISDLLNVSRLRTGKFVIDAHPCNLADVVESEIAQLREQAKNKNQTLEFDKPTDFPVLLLDETKIRQVIMNFSDNALFYTPSGGKIRIELKEDKSHIYFMVKDNGIGVPKEEQKHMFTKFYRAKNARNARPDGTGLGLFMAKKVITAQGGNVLFESIEGKGSTFGFSFNKKHLAESADTDQEEATTNQ